MDCYTSKEFFGESLIGASCEPSLPRGLHRSLQQVGWRYKGDSSSEFIFHLPRSSALVVIARAKGSDQWKYFYVLNLLQNAYFQYRANESNGYYAPLSSRLLDRVLGSRYYKRILADLVDWEVIAPPRLGKCFVDGGKHSREKNAYAFRSEHRSRTIKIAFFSPRRALKAKAAKERQLNELLRDRPNLKHIHESLRRTTIEPAAMEHIDALENATVHEIDCYRRSVEKIINGDFYVILDHRTGRVFTNVANLWADLRGFLRIDGERVSEFDIASSQPLFASKLYPESSEEKERYLGIVLKGEFYRALEAASSRKYPDYKKLKQACFRQVFFGRNSDGTKRPLLRAFRSLFPELLAIFERMKEAKKNALALRLQSEEAQLVIGRVVGQLRELGIPCLTIHDSILCKDRDSESARWIMDKELQDLIGQKCTIKEKNFAYNAASAA